MVVPLVGRKLAALDDGMLLNDNAHFAKNVQIAQTLNAAARFDAANLIPRLGTCRSKLCWSTLGLQQIQQTFFGAACCRAYKSKIMK